MRNNDYDVVPQELEASAWTIHALPIVRADRTMLRSVMVNLLSNAVKYD